jgi:hypothetical protein
LARVAFQRHKRMLYSIYAAIGFIDVNFR